MGNSNPAVQLHAVQFGWPSKPRLLSIETFSVEAGETVFLKGPSGSGKSTLLGLIGGVLLPQSGSVRVLGTELTSLSAGARDQFRGAHIGFVFQMFNLIPYLSLVENVLLPAKFSASRARAGDAEAQRSAAVHLLSALGLGAADDLDRRVTELSIGQQQRVAAARALFGQPELIVADEPTSALDHDARADFLELLLGQCRAQSAALIFVSHDTSLESYFDRALSLQELNRAAA